MPVDPASLVKDAIYYVSDASVVLHTNPDGTGAQNHLLLGDWLRYLGETNVHTVTTASGAARTQHFAKVRCRGDTGWLETREFDAARGLEVNFVDVGQGDGCHIVTPDDQVLLIDAGVSDNLNRFLSWRYNLRGRNVARAPGFDVNKDAADPWTIDHVVMTHPDNDHYLGFRAVFENLKLTFGPVYHNGIVERPAEPPVSGVDYGWDLGGVIKGATAQAPDYLFDCVIDPAAHKALVAQHPATTKQLIATFRALYANTPGAVVTGVGVPIDNLATPRFLPGFEDNKPFSLQILGPAQEQVEFSGHPLTTLRTLGSESVTKNGHSVIFKARYNNLTLLLGGDLNTQAQNFLLRAYAGDTSTLSDLRKRIAALEGKTTLTAAQTSKLADLKQARADQLAKGNAVFGVDIAKACHHGSPHILDEFIAVTNAVATIISSGDNESHGHPRPDALGAYGKHSRGNRPLIFSTELARSTNEFSPYISSYLDILAAVAKVEAATDPAEKSRLITELENKKDRNVAVYGMITVRAHGDKVIIAQKLEKPATNSRKWDIHELVFDSVTGQYSTEEH